MTTQFPIIIAHLHFTTIPNILKKGKYKQPDDRRASMRIDRDQIFIKPYQHALAPRYYYIQHNYFLGAVDYLRDGPIPAIKIRPAFSNDLDNTISPTDNLGSFPARYDSWQVFVNSFHGVSVLRLDERQVVPAHFYTQGHVHESLEHELATIENAAILYDRIFNKELS